MTTNQLKWAEIKEGIRHNLATEEVATNTLAESVRHNTEQERVNFMNALANQTQAAAATRQASVAQYNADIRNYEALIADRKQNFTEYTYHDTGRTSVAADTYKTMQEAATESNRTKLVNEQAYQAEFYSSVQPVSQALNDTARAIK